MKTNRARRDVGVEECVLESNLAQQTDLLREVTTLTIRTCQTARLA
jgi:hypothetical protein